MADTNRFRPSRVFASEAVRADAVPPDALSARQRRVLSPAALADRRSTELAYLYGLYVPSPAQRMCEAMILDQVHVARWARPGARDSLYVLGRPGSGKTTAVRAAAMAYHRRRLDEVGASGEPDPTWINGSCSADLVPTIMVTVRAEARKKAFVSQIVDYLGYPTGRMTGTSLADWLPALADRHGVGLLIGDDMRNLADTGRERDAIHNTIKNLNTDLGYQNVSTIYVGNPDENGIGNLFANAQLAQRLIPVWFNDMDFDLQADEDTFNNLVWADYLDDWEKALAPILPDMGEGDLSSRLGRRLWFLTHGSVGGLAGLLKRAVAGTLSDTGVRTRLTLTRERVDTTPMPERFHRPHGD